MCVEVEVDMQAYVVAAKWPFGKLSLVGKLTRVTKFQCCICGDDDVDGNGNVSSDWYDHVGIRFTGLSREQKEEIRDVWEGAENGLLGVEEMFDDVSWDYMSSLRARFHAYEDGYYREATTLHTFPVSQKISAPALFKTCVEMSRADPVNHWFYRLDSLLGDCICCGSCGVYTIPRGWGVCGACTRGEEAVGPSTCAALIMRAIAATRSATRKPWKSDEEALRILRVRRTACSRVYLTAFTPAEAVKALRRGGFVEARAKELGGSLPAVLLSAN